MVKAFLIAGLAGVLALPLVSCQGGSNAGNEGDQASGMDSESSTAVAPEGTTLLVSLQDPLSTEGNTGGDMFQATLLDPVMVDGRTVLPGGSQVRGMLTQVQKPGEGEEQGKLVLTLSSVETAGGDMHRLGTNSLQIVAMPSTEDAPPQDPADEVLGAELGQGMDEGEAMEEGEAAVEGMKTEPEAGAVVAVPAVDRNVHLEAGQRLQFSLTEPTEFPLLAQGMGGE